MKIVLAVIVMLVGGLAQARALQTSDVVAAVVAHPEQGIEIWTNSREQWLEEGSLSDGHDEEYYDVLSVIVDKANLCNSMEDIYNPCRDGRTVEEIKETLRKLGVTMDPDFQAWAEKVIEEDFK